MYRPTSPRNTPRSAAFFNLLLLSIALAVGLVIGGVLRLYL